jgi:hypothetical protein
LVAFAGLWLPLFTFSAMSGSAFGGVRFLPLVLCHTQKKRLFTVTGV